MLGKNIEKQAAVNRSKLIKDTLRSQQMLKLPEGFTIGQAIGEGDCFFHAVAQGLKYLKPDINFTIKSLRNICKAFAESQLGLDSSWLTEALKNDGRSISYYIPRIEFTADDIKKRSKVIDRLKSTTAMWGLPDIDGRIICITYDVRLHFIEVNTTCDGENVITQHLIDRGGYQKDTFNSEVFNKEVYYRENTIHIINKGDFHFEPILRGTVEQVLSYYYDTMASGKKSDSESVCFQQISEVEMNDVTDNQMDCEYYKEPSPGVEVLPADSTIGTIVGYEDRLSNEELQYKQDSEFQESPVSSRVADSSSIDSDSVWYSALTDCGSTVDDIGFIYDEVVERATFFVKTFTKECEEKLSQYYKEAKPGSQIKELGRIVTQSISATNNLISPGPLRFGLLKLLEGINFFSTRTHRKRSKEVSALVNDIALKEVRKILVEASLEIFQSFECQFIGITDVSGSYWKRGIQKLAIDAVSRVTNYIVANSEKERFSIELITKGFILGKSKDHTLTQYVFRKPVELFINNNDKHTKPSVLKSKILSNLKKLQPGYRIQGGQNNNNELLVTSQLYTEVGIKKIDDDIITYYKLKKHNNAEKYGYRLPFAWELEKWKNDSIDKEYTPVTIPEEQYVYILDDRKKEKLANSILKEINGNDPIKKKI
ncbi:OTU domain-containing protein [Wolbachia endosymbiont of Nilaparvata lugens]|uniref:hypothetical protein n=1 Tax=Wolbachia endosymbiont of Nilaparvata lugens TaxID=357143 RepID=UPI00117F2ED9|nr:hypothetical protein [Wolbachia endosymbiont of Nilaparvata lugens]